MPAHLFQHGLQSNQLRIEDRPFKFGGAEVVPRELQIFAILIWIPIEGTTIYGDGAAIIYRLAIGNEGASFAAGDILEEVEGIRACMADRPQLLTTKSTAHCLTRILNNQEFSLAGDAHETRHVAWQTDHVNGDDRFRVSRDPTLYIRGRQSE